MELPLIHTDIIKYNLCKYKMEQLLHEIYYNPKTGFQSKKQLYQKAKTLNNKITQKIVSEWFNNQTTNQLTKTKPHKPQFNTIVAKDIKHNFQIDLMNLPNPKLNKFKYLLTCIDVYSRKAFVEPIKDKSTKTVLTAFKKIMKRAGIPQNLNTDAGKEFINSKFKTLLENNYIAHFVSNPEQDNKNAIIERFHRTLRNYILKYELSYKKPYIDDLDKLIKNYNTTEHSTTQEKPNDIWKGKEENNQEINKVKYDFEKGDKVRYLLKASTFTKKSSNVKYSKSIYTISRIEGNAYYLSNNINGNDLKKPYRGHELIKAVGGDFISKYDEKINKAKNTLKVNKVLKKLK